MSNGNSLLPILRELAKVVGAKFAGITYTSKVSGKVLTAETAKHTIILGASTEELYKRDIPLLSAMLATLSGDALLAATELLDSRVASVELGVGNTPEYTQADTYIHIDGLPGVKLHKDTGALYLSGLAHDKTVIVPGTYRVVKSSPKTIAKDKIRKDLPSGRFRTFALSNVSRAALNGNVLEVDE